MRQRLEIDHKNGYITSFDMGVGSGSRTVESYYKCEKNGHLRLISREEYSRSTSYGKRNIEKLIQMFKNL